MPTESGSIWLLLSLFHHPPAAEGGEGFLHGYHTALKGHYIIHCVHSSQQQGQKRGISVCQDTPLGPLVLKWPEDGAPHTCFADKTAGLEISSHCLRSPSRIREKQETVRFTLSSPVGASTSLGRRQKSGGKHVKGLGTQN